MRSSGELLRDVKKGNIDPVYFLLGGDYYLQNLIINEISKTIFKEIKQDKTFLFPDEMKSEDIINKITQNDLFSSKKLLVIRNPGSLRNKARLDFLSYCKNPMINNCLIIIEDDFSDRKSITKELKKINNTISVQTPFPNEMRKWTKFILLEKQLNFQEEIIDIIVEIAGDSLFHIYNEIEKMSLNVDNNDELTNTLFKKLI